MKRALILGGRALRARGTVAPPVTVSPEPERPTDYFPPAPAVPSGRPRIAYQAEVPTSRLITIG